jgi:four helix bundle protein
MVGGYKELKVWQRAKLLVSGVYRLTSTFPRDELYGLTNQMRRCAVSIVSNIAEGHARSQKDFLRFLDIAYGSLNELETQMEIAVDLKFVERAETKSIAAEIQEIGKMINGLKKSLGSAR